MNQPSDVKAKATHPIFGTNIPAHWYKFLTELADKEELALYSLIRKRMLERGITEADIELAAERAKIPTLNQKQRLFVDLFKDDGLPEWQLPRPKKRRVMSKPRKATRDVVEDKRPKWARKRPEHALGVWIGLTPTQFEKLRVISDQMGIEGGAIASSLFVRWLDKQIVLPQPHAIPEPHQPEME
jgi:hypothetical protein